MTETVLDRRFLEALRRAVIMLLNALDDALGLPRTIPPKEQRRKERRESTGALSNVVDVPPDL